VKQILTIADLLQRKQAQYPRYASPATFQQASRWQKGADPQQALLGAAVADHPSRLSSTISLTTLRRLYGRSKASIRH